MRLVVVGPGTRLGIATILTLVIDASILVVVRAWRSVGGSVMSAVDVWTSTSVARNRHGPKRSLGVVFGREDSIFGLQMVVEHTVAG